MVQLAAHQVVNCSLEYWVFVVTSLDNVTAPVRLFLWYSFQSPLANNFGSLNVSVLGLELKAGSFAGLHDAEGGAANTC